MSNSPSDSHIVASQHLISAKSPELSEFEFGLIVANHAFMRWVMRCMLAANMADLAFTDILVLHHVHHKKSEKRLGDICFVLNIEDTHVVSYALKKLVGLKLVKSEKRGKEVFFSITKEGEKLCAEYRKVRENCLMPGFSGAPDENEKLAELARFLRTLSGRYDQAARAATSLY